MNIPVERACLDAGIPCVVRQQTCDIQQHAEEHQGWDLQLMQLSSGCFKGQMVQFELDGLSLIRESSNQALLKRGALSRHQVSFNFPLSKPCDPLICLGRRYDYGGVLAVMGGELPEIRVAADLDVLSLSVDYQKLAGLSDETQEAIERLQSGPCYLPSFSSYQALTRLFDLSCQWLVLRPDLVCRSVLSDAFLGHIVDALAQGAVESVMPSERKRVVDRAREVIDAHHDEPVSIPSICHDIGVSQRKLQYCFQEYLGVSPATYVRLFRLNAVHRSLACGDAWQVQDAAIRWGFFHLGHFAMAYRQLFGERPSETLERSRRNSAKSG